MMMIMMITSGVMINKRCMTMKLSKVFIQNIGKIEYRRDWYIYHLYVITNLLTIIFSRSVKDQAIMSANVAGTMISHAEFRYILNNSNLVGVAYNKKCTSFLKYNRIS